MGRPKPRLMVFGFDTDLRDGAPQAVTDELRDRHGLRATQSAAAIRRPEYTASEQTTDVA